MTIEEAIELLEHYVKNGYIVDTIESLRFYHHSGEEAANLGIEALKVVKDSRESGYFGKDYRLPGETEK